MFLKKGNENASTNKLWHCNGIIETVVIYPILIFPVFLIVGVRMCPLKILY